MVNATAVPHRRASGSLGFGSQGGNCSEFGNENARRLPRLQRQGRHCWQNQHQHYSTTNPSSGSGGSGSNPSVNPSPNSKSAISSNSDGGSSNDVSLSYLERLRARLAGIRRGSSGGLLSGGVPLRVAARAGGSAFFGIGCLTALHYGPWPADGWAAGDVTMVLGSFGATAVLVYGYPAAPFSQPKNVVLGHIFSAACGIAAHKYLSPVDLSLACDALTLGAFDLAAVADTDTTNSAAAVAVASQSDTPILAAPVAVAVATTGMMALGIVHPPAGGTCLIACMGSDVIHGLGWQFLIPTAFGSTFLCTTAFFVNNMSPDKARQYPAGG